MDPIALQIYYQQILDGQYLTPGQQQLAVAAAAGGQIALAPAPQPHHALITPSHLTQQMMTTPQLNPMQLRYLFRRTARPGSRPVKCELCDITLNSQLQAKQHFTGKNHLRRVRHEERKKRGVLDRRSEGHSDNDLEGHCSDEETSSQKDDSPPSKRTRLEGLSPGGSTCSTEASLDTSISVCSGTHPTVQDDKSKIITQNSKSCPNIETYPIDEEVTKDELIEDASSKEDKEVMVTKFTKTTTTSYETRQQANSVYRPEVTHCLDPLAISYQPVVPEMFTLPANYAAAAYDVGSLTGANLAYLPDVSPWKHYR